MQASSIPVIERNLQHLNGWIKAIGQELGVQDQHLAYSALRSVLLALRDRITADEACDLGAQLPLIVRGIYFEGWKIQRSPQRFRDPEALLERIGQDFAGDADPRQVFTAVVTVLAREIDVGELDHVRHMLPKEVQEMWPEEARRSA